MRETWQMARTLVVALAAAIWAVEAGAQEQVFRINNLVEPESLDPGVVTGVPEHRIVSNPFEGLAPTTPRTSPRSPGWREAGASPRMA